MSPPTSDVRRYQRGLRSVYATARRMRGILGSEAQPPLRLLLDE
ncbi:hypothetical protein [Hyalangium versicolor]|nr:hypothetical protein [Hyalangium versicolor]